MTQATQTSIADNSAADTARTVRHTPGPWNTEGEICEVTGTIAVWHNGPIVYVHDNGNGPANQIANAHLIAAAPELLAALEEVEAFWSEPPSRPGCNLQRTKKLERIRALNSAAIAKAKGEAK